MNRFKLSFFLTSLFLLLTSQNAKATADFTNPIEIIDNVGVLHFQPNLNYPQGITVDTFGNIYVADSENDRIQKYDASVEAWRVIGSRGSELGQFKYPADVVADGSGNIYVADTDNNRIQKYDASVEAWIALGSYGSGLGEFDGPEGVAVDTFGNIYVADTDNNRIQKYDASAEAWTALGSYGSGLGEFDYVSGVAVDGSGNIYVADNSNNRIQKYDVSAEAWTALGSYGSGLGEFDGPDGVAVDTFGNIYVADAWNNRIQKYDVSAEAWTALGSYGSGLGQFDFPQGIAIDIFGNAYVADSVNNRIQKLVYYPNYNFAYSASSNGSLIGDTFQILTIGQIGTAVEAVPDQGYAFLEWSDGLTDNPRTDVAGTESVTVSALFTNTRTVADLGVFNVQEEIERGFISSADPDPTNTPNFTFNTNYSFVVGNTSIIFPALTVATPVGTSAANLTQFIAINKTSESKSELERALSSIQFGIPNFNLSFSSPVTVTIMVGSGYNNQTLQVKYKKEGETSWYDETTCLVTEGNCTFQTNHATTFAVLENTTQRSNNNNSSSSSSSVSTNTTDNSCHANKPVSISDLFQINASLNSAKIFFTPQGDTNDYFISFSEKSNAEEHGEKVTLIREGVQSHTIYQLKPNTIYYVKVRGQNGCMPGEWSNIMSFKTNSKIYYRYSLVSKKDLLFKEKSKTTASGKADVVSTSFSSNQVEELGSSTSTVGQPTQLTQSIQSVDQTSSKAKKQCVLWWCW